MGEGMLGGDIGGLVVSRMMMMLTMDVLSTMSA